MQEETKVGTYRWIDNWVKMPDFPNGNGNGRTHGIVVSKTGNVIVFHQTSPAVLTFSPEGELLSSWGNYPGAHGMTLVEEEGEEFLWLTDQVTKQVVKTTLYGEIVLSIPEPPHPAYKTTAYIPTWLAVNEQRFRGNGDLWLADGYGASLVHWFDSSGSYLLSLDGTEGAGRFNQPHGINFDPRKLEICVSDRGNKQIQVYGTDGTFLRSFGSEYLKHPDMCAFSGNLLIIPELAARVTLVDREDRLIAHLGINDDAYKNAGWPDNRTWLAEGKFNSPHAAAADAFGNIYVVEWITGGRVTKLEKVRE